MGITKNKTLVVLGGGRFSKLLEGLAKDIGLYENIRYFDDVLDTTRISGNLESAWNDIEPSSTFEFTMGIGYLHFEKRKQIFERFREKFYFANLIHPSSFISRDAELAQGCSVFSQVNIEQGAKIGENVAIFNNTSITHDVLVGSHSFISVGVNMGGGVIFGEEVFVGVGATIINDIVIHDRATVCAGTVVTKEVLANEIVVGNPQKVIDLVTLKREALR